MADAPARLALPIEAEGLSFVRGGRALLDGVSFALAETGVTAVMGANGAGKSLLLRMLAALVTPDRGRVHWAGRAPDRARASRIGVVFQRPAMLRRSVLANMRFALKAAGVAPAERRRRGMEALAMGGLDHLARTSALALSGGEQQRLALLRAMAGAPEALLLDEATAHLDPASTQAIENLVDEARRRGTCVLLVTHDLGQARRLADRIAFLHRGRLLEDEDANRFFPTPATEQARAFVEGRLLV